MPSTARRLRAGYLEGRTGAFRAVSIAQIDGHLRALRHQLTQTSSEARRNNLWWDINLLLERRAELTEAP